MSGCDGCASACTTSVPSPRRKSVAHQVVALIGPPNSGKSTLFNQLTGLRQKVANFPGVTVEQRTGEMELPGGGALISSFASYTLEKRLSKKPFGTGVIEGVAGPETANNSGATGAFLPLLTLGIPGNVTIAILIGALMIHGVQPGPLLMKEHPDMVWGVIASMYVGNAMLLVLNLPLIPLWVRVMRVPYYILFPIIISLCIVGAYTVNNSVFDVAIMMIFGVIGYIMQKFDYDSAPLIMALLLGPMFENSFRQSLILSEGSLSIFFRSPISVTLLIMAVLLLVSRFFLRFIRVLGK